MFYNHQYTWHYGTSEQDVRGLISILIRLMSQVHKSSLRSPFDTIIINPKTFMKLFVDSPTPNNFLERYQNVRLDVQDSAPFDLITVENREVLNSPVIATLSTVGEGEIPTVTFRTKSNDDETENYLKNIGGHIKIYGLMSDFKFLRNDDN